jgi:hypothetical protein
MQLPRCLTKKGRGYEHNPGRDRAGLCTSRLGGAGVLTVPGSRQRRGPVGSGPRAIRRDRRSGLRTRRQKAGGVLLGQGYPDTAPSRGAARAARGASRGRAGQPVQTRVTRRQESLSDMQVISIHRKIQRGFFSETCIQLCESLCARTGILLFLLLRRRRRSGGGRGKSRITFEF